MKWLYGLLALVVISFIVSCWLLWRREHTDEKKAFQEAEKQRLEAKARYEAERGTRGNRLEKVSGKNGRSVRVGSPINRRKGI